jgi:hypothetical protein
MVPRDLCGLIDGMSLVIAVEAMCLVHVDPAFMSARHLIEEIECLIDRRYHRALFFGDVRVLMQIHGIIEGARAKPLGVFILVVRRAFSTIPKKITPKELNLESC